LKQFEYKNGTIHFSDTGSGNTIVLLHGYLENHSMWDFHTPEMTKNNRVIAIDLLGHGKSSCIGYIHTMEDQAEMIVTVLEYLKINKATLIGHSMGGYVALAFAEFFPQKVTKLVLINSTSLDDSNERKQNRDRAIQMAKKDYASFVSLSISNLFSEENRNILITEIEKVKLIALKTPLQGIIAAQEGMKIRKKRLEIFRKINIPKLLILSEKDPILNYSENRKQVEESTIQLATLPDGHMSFIENRKELIAVLDAFL